MTGDRANGSAEAGVANTIRHAEGDVQDAGSQLLKLKAEVYDLHVLIARAQERIKVLNAEIGKANAR